MRTRGEIEDTVDALSYKADVPSRVKEAVAGKVEDVRAAISDALPDRQHVRKIVDDVAGNPAALIVGSIVAGALIGMALPTRR